MPAHVYTLVFSTLGASLMPTLGRELRLDTQEYWLADASTAVGARIGHCQHGATGAHDVSGLLNLEEPQTPILQVALPPRGQVYFPSWKLIRDLSGTPCQPYELQKASC